MGIRKRQPHGQGRAPIRHIASQRHAMRHANLSAVLIGRAGMVDSIAMSPLICMQKIRVIELHRTRMGVDKWRNRLQGDKQPERQESDGSV